MFASNKEIGDRLKYHIQKRYGNQKNFAAHMELYTESNWSKILNGKTPWPNPVILEAVCKKLRIDEEVTQEILDAAEYRTPTERPNVSTTHDRKARDNIRFSANDTINSLPIPDLLKEGLPQTPSTPVVDREYELLQLEDSLKRTLAGQGQVNFITGESGRGKTTLIKKFVRRAQENYPNLLVVKGGCKLRGGPTNPYAPFCEVMDMLTGDAESLLAAERDGFMTHDHVLRMWESLMPRSILALLDHSPNLMNNKDIMPSGFKDICNRIKVDGSGNPNWISRLEKLEGQKDILSFSNDNLIYREYITFLKTLVHRGINE